MRAVDRLEFPLYQPIEVQEFAHCSAQQPCEERYAMIEPRILGANTLLDVGCHTGWFCRAFSRYHLKTVGIDRSADWISIARELHPEGDYRHNDVSELELPEVDVALCLSVAMYFGDDLWPILNKISIAARSMFFDFGGQYASRLPFDESTVMAQMVGNTAYREALFLGKSDIGRPMYLLTR